MLAGAAAPLPLLCCFISGADDVEPVILSVTFMVLLVFGGASSAAAAAATRDDGLAELPARLPAERRGLLPAANVVLAVAGPASDLTRFFFASAMLLSVASLRLVVLGAPMPPLVGVSASIWEATPS